MSLQGFLSMTDAFTVAVHWPFVRRNLELDRSRALRSALDTLAELQVRATGELVRLGRSRLRSECALTAGEAGAVYNALRELERRRVVTRLRDAGNRADAWGFLPDVRRWRSMPWRSSGRAVEDAVGLCICSTVRAFAARVPGQSVAAAARFWLSPEDHLSRPGLMPVDSRGNGAAGGANARRPGEMPVDSRGKCATGRPLVLSSDEDIRLRRLRGDDDDGEKLKMLLGGIRENTGSPVWPRSEPMALLQELAGVVTVDQAWAIAEGIRAYRIDGKALRSPSYAAELCLELAKSPAIAGMAEEA